MKINFNAYYYQFDGYGRFNSRLLDAYQKIGGEVKIATPYHISMPRWMQEQDGLSWLNLTISSMPPYLLEPVPGRHCLLSMTEGTVLPEDWVFKVNNSGLERVLVPCQHNKECFENSGVLVPISILPGGIDPEEFPLYHRDYMEEKKKTFTFLTLSDRDVRKGWHEVYDAFYLAFGGKTTGKQDVRLIIKGRPKGNDLLKILATAKEPDKRIEYQLTDVEDMYPVYAQADCVVLPSKGEGWGLPHREAAAMGIPVITQKWSGLDDGHTEKWAMIVPGTIQPIPIDHKPPLGEWMQPDKNALAEKMLYCYNNRKVVLGFGVLASRWLHRNQTWKHSAEILKDLVEEVSCEPVLVGINSYAR